MGYTFPGRGVPLRIVKDSTGESMMQPSTRYLTAALALLVTFMAGRSSGIDPQAAAEAEQAMKKLSAETGIERPGKPHSCQLLPDAPLRLLALWPPAQVCLMQTDSVLAGWDSLAGQRRQGQFVWDKKMMDRKIVGIDWSTFLVAGRGSTKNAKGHEGKEGTGSIENALRPLVLAGSCPLVLLPPDPSEQLHQEFGGFGYSCGGNGGLYFSSRARQNSSRSDRL